MTYRLFLVLALALPVSLAVAAGGNAAGRGSAAPVALPSVETLRSTLTLTDTQVAQIGPLLDAIANAQQGIAPLQAAATQTRTDAEAKISALLNETQRPLLALVFTPPAPARGTGAAQGVAPAGTDNYVQGPDSKPQDGVPKGKIIGADQRLQITSGVYNGRNLNYQLYIPAQYDGSKPAAVFVGPDGNNWVREFSSPGVRAPWQIPVVFDNLIAKKEIPVIIGIFVDPTNRSEEYDTLGDRFARFITEELLPEVSKTYKLTKDPEGRMIAGYSSSAICAFTVAWERPDEFRKVASFFGSFTSIGYKPARDGQPAVSGGEIYPTLIRTTPIKPLTVFIQDGSNDLNNQYGSWWLANQAMVMSLEWANANPPRGGRGAAGQATGALSAPVRYRVNHAYGDGGHTANHGGSIFPDIMRWMWKDYQQKD